MIPHTQTVKEYIHNGENQQYTLLLDWLQKVAQNYDQGQKLILNDKTI